MSLRIHKTCREIRSTFPEYGVLLLLQSLSLFIYFSLYLGLSFVVGNIHRTNVKCEHDNEIIERLRSAGCIPLLVSANPEFCMSYETNTKMNGKCLNPYDLNRVSGGSSGGEVKYLIAHFYWTSNVSSNIFCRVL